MKKLNIAIIGYGRSGCDIHGAFLRTPENDICNVVAVVENDAARAAAAKEHFGCDTYTSYTELFERKDLDFVVNASYSDLHYPITKDLMEHGFNVLCEKPLCKTPEMVQDLIDTAKKNNVIFTIFHQYRFNDYYIKMYELLEKKVIGDVKLVRACQNSFARRYDWQTLLYRDAGTMRNNAAHSIEQIMHLAGSDEMPKIYSHMNIWNSVGDAEDYMYCVLEYSNGVRYEMEVNPSDAYASEAPLFKIYGTRGTMRVYNQKIEYKYFAENECPDPNLDHKSLHKEDGSPAYCNNRLVWHEEMVELEADVWNSFTKCSNRFYHKFYDTLVNGAELFMKPEHIKAQIAIFNEIERQNPLEVKFAKPEGVL
uniref:Gfo/Idh/MocA family protein n=1 Tax=Agathobacter sp. TaxID=2021311 RepID=UPI0040564E09